MTASAKRRVPQPRKVKPTPTRQGTKQTTKLDALVTTLRRAKGASISDLMEVTGWQAHSVRGAIAGALKKKRGLAISSTKAGDERMYKLDAKK